MSLESQSSAASHDKLRRLFLELANELKSGLAEPEFFSRFVPRVAAGLDAVAVAVWLLDGPGLRLAEAQGLESTGLTARPELVEQHAQQLQPIAANGRPCLIAPGNGNQIETGPGNPTPFLLATVPLRCADEVVGLVETFQRPESLPAVQRGHVGLLADFCELASQYLQARQLKTLLARQSRWDHFLAFNRLVHSRLDLKSAALQVVHEGRRVVPCERMSLAVRQGRKMRVVAISGQEHVDPRSAAVKRLQDLAEIVVKSREGLIYGGRAAPLEPQVQNALDAYLEETPMRTVLVVPLVRPLLDPQSPPEAPFGALVVEQSEDVDSSVSLWEQTQLVAEPAATALANALEHESLFLLPVWRALGKASQLVQAGTWPKTLAVMAALVSIALALTFIPADFKLEGRGVLQPVERREVFAEVDGVVADVHVRHGSTVAKRDLLATLQNFELERQIEGTAGQRAVTVEHLSALEVALSGDQQALSATEQARLHGERLADKQTITSLDQELELLERKSSQLEIRSPIAGEVVTWNVADLLRHRPVKRGDALFSVVNPAAEWELQVRMPEERMGHISQARAESDTPLAVSFVAAHQPDRVLQGRLIDAERRAEVGEDDGNIVRLQVAINRDELRDLRPGAEVMVRVHCGRRALGYVWFHDVLAFIQSRIFFRLR
ncbi:MAG: HlyD family efflux transporter periplasmic adaptor subunit [Pirellulales bacterium]